MLVNPYRFVFAYHVVIVAIKEKMPESPFNHTAFAALTKLLRNILFVIWAC